MALFKYQSYSAVETLLPKMIEHKGMKGESESCSSVEQDLNSGSFCECHMLAHASHTA